MMSIWLLATIGGLGLLLLLNRQPPRSDGLALAGHPTAPMAMERGVTPQAVRRGATSTPRGEAQMARWLRPSVQAARYAEPGRYPRQADDEPDED
jgi:hypothetical protein